MTRNSGWMVSRFDDRGVLQVLGLPANKMKISRDGVGVVKDHFSLAFYNVSPDITLLLGTRERGGGRKK